LSTTPAGKDIWRTEPGSGTLSEVDEETGIYRGEVLAIMGALADVSSDTAKILGNPPRGRGRR